MDPKIVSLEEWNQVQKEFAEREAEFAKITEELSADRRRLPWVKIDKPYIFDGPDGKESFSDLFEGRSQLIVQHFMFSPEWKEGCRGCSAQADSVDGARYHFEPKDVSFVAISRAPIEKLEAFQKRMGWNFKWVSSGENEFNYDFHVSFTKEEVVKGQAFYNYQVQDVGIEDLPGISVFYKNKSGEIFRTYSNYSGSDFLLPFYGYLDLSPVGRNENECLDWIRHHDTYE